VGGVADRFHGLEARFEPDRFIKLQSDGYVVLAARHPNLRRMPPTNRMLWVSLLFQVAASATPHAFGAASAGLPSPPVNQSQLVGFWVTPDGSWVVEITPCISGFCGQLVGLNKSASPTALRLDAHNPDPAKHDRPLCGLLLMGSFKPTKGDAGKWEDGWVYDPQSGETYSGRMWLDGPFRLKVRRYLIIPLFGRNETFTRETGSINRCSAAPDE